MSVLEYDMATENIGDVKSIFTTISYDIIKKRLNIVVDD